jgi:ABC-type glucose/galactose transport system permease subunit
VKPPRAIFFRAQVQHGLCSYFGQLVAVLAALAPDAPAAELHRLLFERTRIDPRIRGARAALYREASRYAGLHVGRIRLGVFVLSSLTAGVAAFLGAAFYGSATSSDANGYELYVIASAVVGGASLSGGRGSALSATLGALLIVLIRQAIRTLQADGSPERSEIGCVFFQRSQREVAQAPRRARTK